MHVYNAMSQGRRYVYPITQIETFFFDQKSRGFTIDKSHLSDPERLSPLLMVSCLVYLWIVCLGVCAIRDDWIRHLH